MGSSLRLWSSSGKRPPDSYEKDCFPTSPVAHVHTHRAVFSSVPHRHKQAVKYRCLSLVVNYTHHWLLTTLTKMFPIPRLFLLSLKSFTRICQYWVFASAQQFKANSANTRMKCDSFQPQMNLLSFTSEQLGNFS